MTNHIDRAELDRINTTAVRDFLAALASGNVNRVLDLHTDDCIIEFPNAPTGFPARVVGRTAIEELERPISEKVVSCEFHDVKVRPLAEPNAVLAEYRGILRLSNGRPYNNTYCIIFTLRSGRFCHIREYFDPRAVIKAGLVEAAFADTAG